MSTSSSHTSPLCSCRHGGRSGMSKADAPEPASSPCRPITCWDKSLDRRHILAQSLQIVMEEEAGLWYQGLNFLQNTLSYATLYATLRISKMPCGIGKPL